MPRRRIPRRTLRAVSLAVVILLAVAAFLASQRPPSTDCRGSARCFTGTVTAIVDGDTLDVGSERIRLALVDTPETYEAGYQEAKDFTATMCSVGTQALVDEDDGQTEGSYGRIVAAVLCGGKNLNAELLRTGHAAFVPGFCDVSEFADEAWASPCR